MNERRVQKANEGICEKESEHYGGGRGAVDHKMAAAAALAELTELFVYANGNATKVQLAVNKQWTKC